VTDVAEIALAPADGLEVVWDPAAVAALAGDGGADAEPWRLEGSLAPGFAALRVISGATPEGSLVLVCAARPQGAEHHDEDLVAAVVVDPDGESQAISEPLVSTEYAADGSVRRLGLELYKEGDDYPVRGAGDTTSSSSSEADGERRERAELAFRLDGATGRALYETVRPA
jgi:hypothetical protein